MSDNSNQTQPKQTADSKSPESRPSNRGATTSTLQKVTAVACVVLAVLLLGQWWTSRTETTALRAELARRLQLGDSTNKATKTVANTAQEGMQALQARVRVLEEKQAEAIADQAALSQIYQSISKNRDEWALAEVENVLSTASQQLQLSGNVHGALIALKNAQKNLERMDKLQFAPILRSIKQDIKKLQALPEMDLTGAAIRLDKAIQQIDRLSLLASQKTDSPDRKTPDKSRVKDGADKKAAVNAELEQDEWWRPYLQHLKTWSHDMLGDIHQLVQVRKVNEKDALLVSPDQSYFVRENLKLRLLSARVALLSRNEAIFSNDIEVVQEAIVKYFDPLNKQTQVVLETLNQVKVSKLKIQMPALESLNAVYNFKSKN